MTAGTMPGGSVYPIQLALPQAREVNRWWGILWFGMMVRAFLVIPHMLFMTLLAMAIGLSWIVAWIPILVVGRVPSFYCSLAGELLKRSARVIAYVFLFPGPYPALDIGAPGPVDLAVNVGDRSINRLWGIPLVGAFARFIVLIPQLIVLWALAVAAGLVALLVWIPILANGRYPDLAMKIMGVYLQYSARVQGYALMLPVPYPPFDFA